MNPPFYHTFIIYRIRQRFHLDILEIGTIKEMVGRISTRNGGFPKNMSRFVIQDLIDFGLIKKVANSKYRIIHTPLESKIKGLMLSI